MAPPTSLAMACASIIPLPFDIIFTVLRFWIRTKRNAWGMDDWAMLVNIPFWSVSTIATIALAWSGAGAYDASLSSSQMTNTLRWFYVFQEPWCFTLITIKCSIGFALIRIANGKKWIEYIIYACMASCFVVMGGTGFYLFFQCSPVQKNWDTSIEGECQHRSIQTVLSFAVAVVSITTDWIFATLPIFLLWNVQLDWRVKGSVVGMLGLGVFASIAPIVRLKFLIGLNDPTRLIQNLGPILAWASAEMQIGMLVANLPACRPLLERLIQRFSTWTGSSQRSRSKPGTTGAASKAYLELDENPKNRSTGMLRSKQPGIETRIYGDTIDDDGSLNDSEEGIVKPSKKPSLDGFRVNVQHDFKVEVSDAKSLSGPTKGRRSGDMV